MLYILVLLLMSSGYHDEKYTTFNCIFVVFNDNAIQKGFFTMFICKLLPFSALL